MHPQDIGQPVPGAFGPGGVGVMAGAESQRLRALALEWLAAGSVAAIVEVTDTQGSVPRGRGTRMLVGVDSTAGTIGGGHLEWQAIAHARRQLAESGARFAAWAERIPLGPSLGQCCGGVVHLRFTPLGADALEAWQHVQPRFDLQLYGAGHVGRAVVALLANLPCRVQWIDERDDAFPDWPLPPHVAKVCVDAVEAEVAVAPAGSSYLVMTHQHDLDLRIAEAILRRGDARWFGLIGSRTKRARFEHRLQERGLAAPVIATMTCPIGLADIAGKEPEVIAISVVAQLLACHPGASA